MSYVINSAFMAAGTSTCYPILSMSTADYWQSVEYEDYSPEIKKQYRSCEYCHRIAPLETQEVCNGCGAPL